MNKQALENRAFVRNLIMEKYPKYAAILAEFRHTPLNRSSQHFSGKVVGFGNCDIEVPPRFGIGDNDDNNHSDRCST